MLANSVDPDQMPHFVASNLGLHCLVTTLLQVSRSKWVKTALIGFCNWLCESMHMYVH